MDIRFGDLVQLISGPRFDRDRDGELIVRLDGRETKIPFGSLTAGERGALMHFLAQDGIVFDPSQLPIGEPVVTLFQITAPDGYWAPENMVILPHEHASAVEYLERGGLLARFQLNTTTRKNLNPMKTSKTNDVKGRLTESGDLVLKHDGQEMVLPRRGMSTETRTAITNFVKAISELRNIDEWEPGEKVIAARACMLRDSHGLPFAVFRGQELDDRDLIEQALSIKDPEPVRLLRKGVAELEVESILKELLTIKGQEGLAQSTLIQKRTIAAMRGA